MLGNDKNTNPILALKHKRFKYFFLLELFASWEEEEETNRSKKGVHFGGARGGFAFISSSFQVCFLFSFCLIQALLLFVAIFHFFHDIERVC